MSFFTWLRSNERVPPSFAPHVMSPAAVDSKLREPVGAGFERAKERIARRRRGKGDRDGSLPDDLCAPAVEDAVPNIPNTSSDARGESSDDGELRGDVLGLQVQRVRVDRGTRVGGA